MDFIDQITALASRVHKQLPHIQTEEATKTALILPFINALGYNVFDPTEVVPEFTADVGIKKGEKVDYAIHLDGKPIMLFECKHVGADLNNVHASQLFRYFHVTEARIGVLTNGLVYRFYSDLEKPNKMDERPFLEFDLTDVRETIVEEVKKLSKASFDIQQLLSTANELKYMKLLKQYLGEQWANPSEEFVRFLTKQVYEGAFSASIREQFTEIVRRSLNQFVSERISDRLKTALLTEQAPMLSDRQEAALAEQAVGGDGEAADVVTTEDELEGFRIVRAILREIVPVTRVAMRDVKSYFGILLDDNNRKPIARLYFNTAQKQIGVFNEKREEVRHRISSLDDLYLHAQAFKSIVLAYNNKGVQSGPEA